MSMECFRKFSAVSKVQARLVLRTNVVLCLLLAVLVPLLFGVNNLDETAAAYVLERYFILSGALLFTPLFFPEQKTEIRELVESKKTGACTVFLVRLSESAAALLLLFTAFLEVMKLSGCTFSFARLLYGGVCSALFLGALGFFTCAVLGNLVAGYLVSAGYFMLNFFAGNRLGNFYLFSLSAGTMQPKLWLLAGACLLFFSGLFWRVLITKLR